MRPVIHTGTTWTNTSKFKRVLLVVSIIQVIIVLLVFNVVGIQSIYVQDPVTLPEVFADSGSPPRHLSGDCAAFIGALPVEAFHVPNNVMKHIWVSQPKRDWLVENPKKLDVDSLNAIAVKSLGHVDIDNSISRYGDILNSTLRVGYINAERGRYWCEYVTMIQQSEELREVDIWLLNEFDLGMARSANMYTIRLFAHALGLNYAFGAEFIELTHGTAEETQRADTLGLTDLGGIHGNGILSKWPILDASIVRHPDTSMYYVQDPKYQRFTADGFERRLGGRMALLAKVEMDHDRSIVVGSLHNQGGVQNEPEQTEPMIKLTSVAIESQCAGLGFSLEQCPIVLAGDTWANTGTWLGLDTLNSPVPKQEQIGVSVTPGSTLYTDFFMTKRLSLGSPSRAHISAKILDDGSQVSLSDHQLLSIVLGMPPPTSFLTTLNPWRGIDPWAERPNKECSIAVEGPRFPESLTSSPWPKEWIVSRQPQITSVVVEYQPSDTLGEANMIVETNSSVPDSFVTPFPLVQVTQNTKEKWYERMCPEAVEFYKEVPSFKERYVKTLDTELATMMACNLHVVSKLLLDNDIPHTLFAGCLLGNVNHHGPMLWDDDTDILVDASHLHRIIAILNEFCNRTDFSFKVHVGRFLKVYYNGPGAIDTGMDPASDCNARSWPFVDIFFSTVDSGDLAEIWAGMELKNRVPLTEAFPMKWGFFAGRWVPVLSHALEHVNSRYKPGCVMDSFDHLHDVDTKKTTFLDCSKLQTQIPFVYRSKDAPGRERLALLLPDSKVHVFHDLQYSEDSSTIRVTKYK